MKVPARGWFLVCLALAHPGGPALAQSGMPDTDPVVIETPEIRLFGRTLEPVVIETPEIRLFGVQSPD